MLTIRHYGSITEIRRALKKLDRVVAQDIRAIKSNKALLNLASLVMAHTSPVASRIKSNAQSTVRLNNRNELLAGLNYHSKVARHLQSLVLNEFPQEEYLVKKINSEINALVGRVDQTIAEENEKAAATVAENMPPQLDRMINQLLKQFLDPHGRRLKYGSIDRINHYIDADQNGFVYTVYFDLSSITDLSGYKYNIYYVVLTYQMGRNGGKFFLTTLNDWRKPLSFDPGSQIKDAAEGAALLKSLFVSQNFLKGETDAK